MQRGKFISIEGSDGAGKSSVIQALAAKLNDLGYTRVLVTREPGGVDIAEQIREVILNVDNTAMDKRTEALLYAAARRQHLVQKVVPALSEGYIVLCDRFVDSSLAYQGVARGIDTQSIWEINRFAIEDQLPDITLLIDVPAEVGLARIYANRQEEVNRLDQESMAFHQLVRDAFLKLEQEHARIQLVDGTQSIEKVVDDCLMILQREGIIKE